MPTRSSSVPNRVSRECEALRRRLTQWRATRPHLRAAMPEPGPTFVELPLASSSSIVLWVLEFRGSDGRVLRVQVPPMPLSDLVTLGRAAWSGA